MKKALFVWACMILACMGLLVKPAVRATVNYDSKIQDAQKRQEELEEKQKDLKREIEELEKDKEDVVKYIAALDQKMGRVVASLNQIKGDMTEKRKELKEAKRKLRESQANAKSQYETMKKRIKYMYENGNTQYLELIFGAKDIGDLLNRSEYVEKLSEYDRNMLKRYRVVCRNMEEEKKEIESQMNELKELKKEADTDRGSLKVLTASKKDELEKYNSSIDKSSEQRAAFEAKAAKAEEEVEQLLLAKQRQIEAEERARREAEERARREAESRKSESGGGAQAGGVEIFQGVSGMRWPLNVSGTISSYFGRRKSPTAGASSYHKGLDIAAASGTPIVASGDGKVVTAAYSSSAGNYIMLYHGASTYTVYMHCSRLAISEGGTVKKGQVIAYVGSTGISTGNHLHFGIMKNGTYVDPLGYISR